MEELDLNAFNALTDRQKDFLLDKMADPETGTRYFTVRPELAEQTWFERLTLARPPGDSRIGRITGGLAVSALSADIVLKRHEAAVSGGPRLFDYITDFMGFRMVSRAGFEPATH